MKRLSNAWRALIVCIEVLTAMLVAGIVLTLATQIVLRYIFGAPLVWSDELADFQFVWVSFLACVVLAFKDAHLKAEVLPRYLGAGVNRWREFIILVITIAFLAIVFSQAIPLVLTFSDMRSPTMRISMGFLFSAVLVASGLMILEYGRQLWVLTRRILSGPSSEPNHL